MHINAVVLFLLLDDCKYLDKRPFLIEFYPTNKNLDMR